jgi:hypothetical protein
MPRIFSTACLLILALVVYLPGAYSQNDPPAVVTFSLDFPTSTPEHYSIRIPSEGAAHYQSTGRLTADSEETDSFDLDFPVTAETREKIFALVAKAGYLQKDVDSHHKGLAFTGKKTLEYKDARRSGEATYNYSTVAAVEEITGLFQSLSATLEFGHRLQYDHQYQKLALDQELKRMEQMARDNQLIEVVAVRSILDPIIADRAVINGTRARAQRLLEQAGAH